MSVWVGDCTCHLQTTGAESQVWLLPKGFPMSCTQETPMIEVHYLGETLFLIKRGDHWTNWWRHPDFGFSDGKPYPSSEAALAAIQDVVRRSGTVKLICSLLGDWQENRIISPCEMFHVQLSLMSFLA